ncbi:hypothetical protein [Nocardia sp. CDC160]|uniref:hypothetical protein n=1 Tax=Nocardia sp. CDC160 TaxID=3112166 RepID=UPI002DBB4760|nr:hypothetical protein [Nocardia sp. CDC160]MEC3916287.1 hypothetical protein [Nocardia sp. CDC160]
MRPARAPRPGWLGAAGLLALTAIQAAPLDASAAPTNPLRPVIAPAELAQQMRSAIQAASPGTRVGIDVIDNTTDATLADLDSDQQFYTASVVKLLIAVDELRGRDWQSDSDTAADIHRMLSASDDDIADRLWCENGGTAIVNRMVDLIGLTGTQPPTDPAEWGETRTTPKDVVAIYRYLTTVLPEPARELIVNGLRDSSRIAADGTDQYFGIPDGFPDAPRAIKQGWMALDTSTTMNTTGLVGTSPGQPLRYTVVVLTSQPADVGWTAGGAALTRGLVVLRDNAIPPTRTEALRDTSGREGVGAAPSW